MTELSFVNRLTFSEWENDHKCVSVNLHTLYINQLTLGFIAASVQVLSQVFYLVSQSRIQIKLYWKFRNPVPTYKKSGEKMQWKTEDKTYRGEFKWDKDVSYLTRWHILALISSVLPSCDL